MIIRRSKITGMPIISSRTESVIARIRFPLLNPETGKVEAFVINKMGKVLMPVDIQKWTRNAVIVSNKAAFAYMREIVRLQNLDIKRAIIMNKKVLTKDEEYLGRVTDYTINTTYDTLHQIYIYKSKFIFFSGKGRIVPASRIDKVTEKEIIINTDESVKEAEKETAKSPALAGL